MSATATAAVSKAGAVKKDSVPEIIAASMVGTAIEFYDFYAYGTAAANYFPKVFFGDTTNPTVALLASLLTFAIAFIARPLGSLIFGHFGDRMGRKTTLVVSLLTMGIATFLIGCLPTYNQWGVAAVAVLCLCTGALSDYNGPQKAVILCAVGLVCLGVVGLGVVEAREDDDLRRRRQEHANRKYAKSWLAICLPVAYCLLDAAGTFADSLVLERLNEDSANVAYELTFLAAGIGCLVYLLARREKFTFKAELPKYVGAACETAGQLFYIYALADEEHVMMSAPIISAYCVASVLWSRLFLKEKLSWKHYLMIGFVVAGIVILGIYDI